MRASRLAALALLLAAGPGRAAAAGPGVLGGLVAGKAAAGSALFVARGCVDCHAVHGEGGRSAPDLGRLAVKRPLLETAGVLWNHGRGPGGPGVPGPALEVEEMASLLAFLYHLTPETRAGDPGAGARLFEARGCRTCHQVGGTGGTVGPALDRFSRYASPLFLGAALWTGGPKMARTMRERGVPRPEFTGADIADLMAFIRGAGREPARVYARPGDPEKGEALFRDKRCAECHALAGGGGGIGPDLGARGRLRGTLPQIAGAMWNHGPAMWAKMAERGIPVPALAPGELSDLVGFLYYFQFVDPPGEAARGAVVARDRGCAACHGATGIPGAAPTLAESEAFDSAVGLSTALWNHARRLAAKGVTGTPPLLAGRDVADLVAHVRALRGRVPVAAGKGS